MDASFYSIEALFQAMKFLYLLHQSATVAAKEIQKLTEEKFGAKAKSAGGKGVFKRLGLVLDKSWTSVQNLVMKMAVEMRASVDKEYADKLIESSNQQFTWMHFEFRGTKYWGGQFSKATGEWIGKNMLGKIMRQVGDELVESKLIRQVGDELVVEKKEKKRKAETTEKKEEPVPKKVKYQ